MRRQVQTTVAWQATILTGLALLAGPLADGGKPTHYGPSALLAGGGKPTLHAPSTRLTGGGKHTLNWPGSTLAGRGPAGRG